MSQPVDEVLEVARAEVYRGRPWRSRFLRAPAAALELADRDDFVALGTIAEVSLGLKTGADGFFFVRMPDLPRARTLGNSRSRTPVSITGHAGWTGQLAAGDVRPALLNPHRLQPHNGPRRFGVPDRMEDGYLYPADRPPKYGLSDYIEAGEREGINVRNLVQANATGDRWDRQRRPPIDWRWVLPYNSAYDYGAHDNTARRVLNGRFVGCQPADDGSGVIVDEELLGAVLNSTFTIFTRLLEGVSTGSEGAYDVGPPAARLMRIPDPRLMTDATAAARVRDALAAWRAADIIPPAPAPDGAVSTLRRNLDTAILVALGATPGEAAHQLGLLYASYGRWRAAVQGVEMRVRVNRRALSGAGRDRTERPADLVARQVWDELSVDAPMLPAAVLAPEADLEQVSVAQSFRAPDTQPIFAAGHVIAPNGTVIDLGDWERVRYADMLLRLGFSPPLLVPSDTDVARAVADQYVTARTALEAAALRLAKQSIGPTQARDVADAVLRMWRRACRDGGMAARL